MRVSFGRGNKIIQPLRPEPFEDNLFIKSITNQQQKFFSFDLGVTCCVARKIKHSIGQMKLSEPEDRVFCRNTLSGNHAIVDARSIVRQFQTLDTSGRKLGKVLKRPTLQGARQGGWSRDIIPTTKPR
ncbi:hypothetical protein CPSG_03449 [Coccidioides posadasii str. Silveira]|uniref:Uncharacterized protein n=1 Tax=Coccidioides posadasii (strain RMSCC 757 / Silveira) TaxID=443226 RepID=E9D021_COCPS|nr:hypothetical protein CPSG_03449 [Coccidioides posadasii str. Silveira]